MVSKNGSKIIITKRRKGGQPLRRRIGEKKRPYRCTPAMRKVVVTWPGKP